jgi:hypothetical protein
VSVPADETSKAKAEKKGHEKGADTYGVVYANEPARAAFAAGGKFPPGSVIVREKLSKPGGATPQLLAVMFKRAAGFNPAGGDWEFLTVNGALTKVTGRQKRGSCLDCHASRRERDFVFPVK